MRKHILIVDDEELFREICEEMLTECGYRVSVAADAPAGLSMLRADHVDLLVADITLPGMDGLTLIEHVQSVRPDMPVIVITGALTQENMLRSLNLGVRGFLTKPFFYDELFKTVAQVLSRSSAAQEKVLIEHYQPMIELGQTVLRQNGAGQMSTVLDAVLRIAVRQTGSSGAMVLHRGDHNGPFHVVASHGLDGTRQTWLTALASAGLEAAGNWNDEVATLPTEQGHEIMIVRNFVGGRVSGGLALVPAADRAGFTEEERRLANLLGVQIALATGFRGAADTSTDDVGAASNTLYDLAAALVPTGAGHDSGARRGELAAFAVDLAGDLGVDPGLFRAISTAMVFHDFGLAFVPSALLEKAGPLSDAEWKTMRAFPELGADRLTRVPDLEHAADIVRAHRESWDGTGYPRGMAGKEIPIGARIVGAVSCWGALRSDRPYRRAEPHGIAMATIRSVSGTVLGPTVAEALLNRVENDAIT